MRPFLLSALVAGAVACAAPALVASALAADPTPFGAETRGSAPPPPGGFELGGREPPAPAVVAPVRPSGTPPLAEPPPVMVPEGPMALINAVAYQPVPAGRPVALRLYDDTPDGQRLAARLHDILTASGFTVVTEGTAGALVISFELGETSVAPPPQQGILSLDGHKGGAQAFGRNEDYRARMSLYSSTGKDAALLSGPAAVELNGPTVRFNLALNDGRSGQRLWDGWGTAEVGSNGPAAAAAAMTPALVKAIGLTVRAEPVVLASTAGR